MFGPPQCPIDDESAQWIKDRLGWLTGRFGAERLFTGAAITPAPEYFPHRVEHDEGARRTFRLICGYMDVNPDDVHLVLVDGDATRNFLKDRPHEWSSNQPGGTWDNEVAHRIRISRDTMEDPMRFVAVAAHELGHELLIGKGLLTGDEEDHEPLTDLTTVFFGMGIFGANSCIRYRQFQGLETQGHEWGESGYLELEQWAYALALWSLERGESKPPWLRDLRDDVKATFKRSVKYIRHSGNGLNV